MVGSDALEVTPSVGSLVLGDSRLWYFDREIVLGNSLESTTLDICWHRTFANDGVDAVAFVESSLSNGLYGFREDDAFQHTAMREGILTDAFHLLWQFNNAHQSPVVGKGTVTYMTDA